jgi:hypothetical protein
MDSETQIIIKTKHIHNFRRLFLFLAQARWTFLTFRLIACRNVGSWYACYRGELGMLLCRVAKLVKQKESCFTERYGVSRDFPWRRHSSCQPTAEADTRGNHGLQMEWKSLRLHINYIYVRCVTCNGSWHSIGNHLFRASLQKQNLPPNFENWVSYPDSGNWSELENIWIFLFRWFRWLI